MSDPYLDLYKLELNIGEPYSAKFIRTDEEALPPECLLPTTPDLSPLAGLNLTLPPLECKFDILTPVIPPPYFCTPAVTGTITFIDTGTGNSTGVSFVRDVDTECDYQLNGEILLPCTPVITGTITVTDSGTAETSEIIFEQIDECNYALNGAITIPCTPIVSLTMSSDTETVNFKAGDDTEEIESDISMEFTVNVDSSNICKPTITIDSSFSMSDVNLGICVPKVEWDEYQLQSDKLDTTIYNLEGDELGKFYLDLGSGLVFEEPCTYKISLQPTMSFDSLDVCSQMTLALGTFSNIQIDVTDTGGANSADISGTLTISPNFAVSDDPDSTCGKKLDWSASGTLSLAVTGGSACGSVVVSTAGSAITDDTSTSDLDGFKVTISSGEVMTTDVDTNGCIDSEIRGKIRLNLESGATWQDVSVCIDGVTSTKKILVKNS